MRPHIIMSAADKIPSHFWPRTEYDPNANGPFSRSRDPGVN